MPTSHHQYAKWTPQRLIAWDEKTGPATTATLVGNILDRRAHPQQGFRSCLGIMRLGKRFGEERLEAACRRALTLHACSYKSIDSILRLGRDCKALSEQQELELSIEHDNLRGSNYCHLPQNRRHPLLRQPTLEKLQTLHLPRWFEDLSLAHGEGASSSWPA